MFQSPKLFKTKTNFQDTEQAISSHSIGISGVIKLIGVYLGFIKNILFPHRLSSLLVLVVDSAVPHHLKGIYYFILHRAKVPNVNAASLTLQLFYIYIFAGVCY